MSPCFWRPASTHMAILSWWFKQSSKALWFHVWGLDRSLVTSILTFFMPRLLIHWTEITRCCCGWKNQECSFLVSMNFRKYSRDCVVLWSRSHFQGVFMKSGFGSPSVIDPSARLWNLSSLWISPKRRFVLYFLIFQLHWDIVHK